MPSPNLSRAAAELEGLPSDGGKTVDALAGGLLRTFVRIGELETDLALVNRRTRCSKGPTPCPPQNWTSAGHKRRNPFSVPEREAYLFDLTGIFGGCSRTRTYDPLIKRQLLCFETHRASFYD